MPETKSVLQYAGIVYIERVTWNHVFYFVYILLLHIALRNSCFTEIILFFLWPSYLQKHIDLTDSSHVGFIRCVSAV